MSGPKDGKYIIGLGPLTRIGANAGSEKPVIIGGQDLTWDVKKLDNGRYTLSLLKGNDSGFRVSKPTSDNDHVVVSDQGSPFEWQLVLATGYQHVSSYVVGIPSTSSSTKCWTVNTEDPGVIVTLDPVDITQPADNQRWFFYPQA